MTVEDQVRKARNAQEAMLAIGRAIDRMIESLEAPKAPPLSQWGEWQYDMPREEWAAKYKSEGTWVDGPPERRVEVTGPPENTVVHVPPPSPERQERRRQFERQNLRIGESLGEGADWTEAYVKGGPMWLYLGNRDLFMSYPEHVRAMMVDDVLQDSPEDAHEMARDVLKQPCEMPDIAAGDRALAVGDS